MLVINTLGVMKTFALIICLALLEQSSTSEEVKKQRKRGLYSGYGQWGHYPFAHHAFSGTGPYRLPYINSFAAFPVKSHSYIPLNLIKDQSPEELTKHLSKYDGNFPLGGPVDLGDHIQVHAPHSSLEGLHDLEEYHGQGGHYAPRHMSHYHLPNLNQNAFKPQELSIQEIKTIFSPASIDLSTPSVASSEESSLELGGNLDSSKENSASIESGNSFNSDSLDFVNHAPQFASAPVRTIDSYAKQGSVSDSNQGSFESQLPQAQQSLHLDNTFRSISSTFGSSFQQIGFKPILPASGGYEVTDETADKVPTGIVQGPTLTPIQQNQQAPITVAKALTTPRVGPVTFTPQTSIGSGGLGVTRLPNGGFALGSGSLGYAQQNNNGRQQQNQQQGQSSSGGNNQNQNQYPGQGFLPITQNLGSVQPVLPQTGFGNNNQPGVSNNLGFSGFQQGPQVFDGSSQFPPQSFLQGSNQGFFQGSPRDFRQGSTGDFLQGSSFSQGAASSGFQTPFPPQQDLDVSNDFYARQFTNFNQPSDFNRQTISK